MHAASPGSKRSGVPLVPVLGGLLAAALALAVWGWLEISYLMDFITGTHNRPCPPGARGWRSLMSGAEEVEVLASHWDPFFVTQAGRHGMTEESLRADWEAEGSDS